MKLGLVAAAFALGCSGAQPIDWPVANTGTPRNNCTSLDAGQSGQKDAAPINVWNQHTTDWLQTQPKIHAVFWGQFWPHAGYANFAYESDVLQILLNDPAFYKPMQEYGIGTGSFVGVHISNENIVAANIADNDIQSELLSEISSGVLPVPTSDGNTLYLIMLPQNTPAARCVGACNGYHYFLNYNGINFTYAVIQYNTNPFPLISHEIYEAATDPSLDQFNGGWGESEIGDLCGGQDYTIDNVQAQKLWSQDSCQCIPTK